MNIRPIIPTDVKSYQSLADCYDNLSMDSVELLDVNAQPNDREYIEWKEENWTKAEYTSKQTEAREIAYMQRQDRKRQAANISIQAKSTQIDEDPAAQALPSSFQDLSISTHGLTSPKKNTVPMDDSPTSVTNRHFEDKSCIPNTKRAAINDRR
jgi:hypothetical protein